MLLMILPVRHVKSHVIETAIYARHRQEALRNTSGPGSRITRHTYTHTHAHTTAALAAASLDTHTHIHTSL